MVSQPVPQDNEPGEDTRVGKHRRRHRRAIPPADLQFPVAPQDKSHYSAALGRTKAPPGESERDSDKNRSARENGKIRLRYRKREKTEPVNNEKNRHEVPVLVQPNLARQVQGRPARAGQILRKASVPLVPPKPKLFLMAASIRISRAVLAQ